MASAAHRIFGSTPIPRYVQLAELIRQRVAKGRWPPGSLLPSIEHLMAEFDVARVTVRQAIALLADEELLSPQRGRGTFVTGKPDTRRRLRVETTLDDLVAMYSGDKPDHATLAKGVGRPRAHRQGRHRGAEVLLFAPRAFAQRRALLRHLHLYRPPCLPPCARSLSPRAGAAGPHVAQGAEDRRARQTLTISTADVETVAAARHSAQCAGRRGAARDVRARTAR